MDYLILDRIVDSDYLTRQGLRIRCLPDSACQTSNRYIFVPRLARLTSFTKTFHLT